MKRFFIITNEGKDPGMRITDRVKSFLSSHGAEATQMTLDDLRSNKAQEVQLPSDCAMCIVLGGDGTMLEAAHFLPDHELPLLGVNLGNIGYLTETGADEVEDALQKVLSGAYTIEERMMLKGRVTGADKSQKGEVFHALNDVVVARYGSIRMIRLSVRVNHQPLCDYHADGLILATPTGSTGYSMSVGGPVVEPVARLIVMTPIASHALSTRSIILSPDDHVEVEVFPAHADEDVEAEISFDAAHIIRVSHGDTIEVTASGRTTRIVRLAQASFLDVLHNKMV